MTNAAGFVSQQGMRLALVMAVLLALSACGKGDAPQPGMARKQVDQVQYDLERRMAVMAVEVVAASIESVLDLGAVQAMPDGDLTDKFVAMMNSAQAPDPGEPKTLAPKFTYVANRVSGPWQVVLRLEGETLSVLAYGSNVSQPLEQRTVPISRR